MVAAATSCCLVGHKAGGTQNKHATWFRSSDKAQEIRACRPKQVKGSWPGIQRSFIDSYHVLKNFGYEVTLLGYPVTRGSAPVDGDLESHDECWGWE